MPASDHPAAAPGPAEGSPTGTYRIQVRPEFPLTASGTSNASRPAVATDGAGRYFAAWDAMAQDGSGRNVYAVALGADGVPLGPAFRVNAYTPSDQTRPAIAASHNGFVVVWMSANQDRAGAGVFGQAYDADGNRRGVEFPVHAAGSGQQYDPSVAVASDGHIVVTWSDSAVDLDGLGIAGRLFDAYGVPRGGTFVVNTGQPGSQSGSAVSMAPDGRFVVTWQGMEDPGGGFGVYARRFGAEGAPPGDAFPVAGEVTADTREPAVAVEPDGDFVVAWHTDVGGGPGASGGDGSGSGVFARRYAADGSALGGTIGVNAHTAANQAMPAVATVPDGSFVATWQSAGQDGDGLGVFTRRFGADGAAPEDLPVNTQTAGDQFGAVVAAGTDGGMLVAWQSAATGGAGDGVSARLFALSPPPADPPAVLLSSAPVVEGDTGAAATAVFTVALSGARPYPVSVHYATRDGTAVAPGDYAPASGVVTFAPGETTRSVTVTVIGDSLDEADETFSLEFADPVNATLPAGSVGMIVTDDDAELPTVTGVFVNGTSWTPAFRQHLAAAGEGSDRFGFLVRGGAAQLDDLPWKNVDQISVRFNRDVTVLQRDLGVRGAVGGEYSSALIGYDRDHFTYSWTFPRPFPADRLVLRLDASSQDGVRDARTGARLDGEWAGGADTYPSGNGSAGGDFAFGLDVLPADATRDGEVNAIDLIAVRARQRTGVPRPGAARNGYSIFSDTNGNGWIDVADYLHVRSRQGTNLPPPAPQSFAQGVRAVFRDRVFPVRGRLFSEAPVLA